MKHYYRVTANGGGRVVAYTDSPVAADYLAGIIIGNGYKPHIQTMTKMQIPMNEIELVAEL